MQTTPRHGMQSSNAGAPTYSRPPTRSASTVSSRPTSVRSFWASRVTLARVLCEWLVCHPWRRCAHHHLFVTQPRRHAQRLRPRLCNPRWRCGVSVFRRNPIHVHGWALTCAGCRPPSLNAGLLGSRTLAGLPNHHFVRPRRYRSRERSGCSQWYWVFVREATSEPGTAGDARRCPLDVVDRYSGHLVYACVLMCIVLCVLSLLSWS